MSTKKLRPAESETPAMFDIGDSQPSAVADPVAEEIYAEHCVVGSECNMTDLCRGKLSATRATKFADKPDIGPQVQIYCPVCGKFAKGTRSLHGLTSGVGRLFDRSSGKVR